METRSSPVDELHAIITPFDADAFGRILVQYNLLNDFPNIIQNLMNGFSIFNSTPVISEVFTPPNRKSATDHAEFVNNYFTSEAGVGHITGPYTHDQVREIFKSNGGFFRTSPIGVVPKPRKPGQLQDQYRMVMDLSAPDSHGVSVNSLIDADDFQARWDGARVKGDYVSLICQLVPSLSFCKLKLECRALAVAVFGLALRLRMLHAVSRLHLGFNMCRACAVAVFGLLFWLRTRRCGVWASVPVAKAACSR